MAITLQESLRAVFYAPFYVALARGAYTQEGVEVRFVSAPTPAEAANGLLDGSVDVCWGGPMRVMETWQKWPGCDLVCFAEVVTRDPFMLVGRSSRPGFQLADLVGMSVATVSEVPTPWLCLQQDLRDVGLDPAGLDRAAGLSMTEACARLRGGELDAVQVFEPFASELERDGSGYVLQAAATRGPTSYTVFYAPRPLLTARRAELAAMVRAIQRTQKWLARAQPSEIAATIAAFLPTVSPANLTAASARYKALGIWGHDPRLPRLG